MNHMDHKALVFLSCGQREKEGDLATKIEQMVKKNGLDCYNANSRQGFDDVMSITEQLSKADYYLFIDFKRKITKRNKIPISVFTHQEFALARASGITKMLAFREKGFDFPSPGMVGYVLAHPIEFDRDDLVQRVEDEIGKSKWDPGYSRNLVATGLAPMDKVVSYKDHFGIHQEMIWHVRIENRREDRAALNAVAILEEITPAEGVTPDRAFLKWAYQHSAHQMTIFPKSWAKFDAFAIGVNENGVFLHSDRDVHPRTPVISLPGIYILTYFLYAESFPPVRFKIRLDYRGPILATTTFADSGTEARLVPYDARNEAGE